MKKILIFGLLVMSAISMKAGYCYNGLCFRPDGDLVNGVRYASVVEFYGEGEFVIPDRFIVDPDAYWGGEDWIVTSINYGVFSSSSSTGITSVVIPESVVSISDLAFIGCPGLKAISVSWADPSVVAMGENVFKDVNTSAVTLHVPIGKKAAYQAAAQWSGFNIVDDGQIATSLLSSLSISSGLLTPVFQPNVLE
ncbi:MAG: leucine-rich repeat domain-containing protein, partial [Dysgonamonadaceae bacterium]|nr:leucine-rich repeat domain-containing protein [Dysgonamonadaceae bacterium]